MPLPGALASINKVIEYMLKVIGMVYEGLLVAAVLDGDAASTSSTTLSELLT